MIEHEMHLAERYRYQMFAMQFHSITKCILSIKQRHYQNSQNHTPSTERPHYGYRGITTSDNDHEFFPYPHSIIIIFNLPHS